MLTVRRRRGQAIATCAGLLLALVGFGVGPAGAAADPTIPEPDADTEAPGPLGDPVDRTPGAPPADPGTTPLDVAAARADLAWPADHGRSAEPGFGREGHLPGAAADPAPREASAVPGEPVAGTDGLACTFLTVEDAIAGAAPGSTIYLAPGTHAARTAGINYNVNKDLTLARGTATCGPTSGGSATEVVLAPARGNTADAVLEISGLGTDVVLDRITVEGGTGTEGTVQVHTGSSLRLVDAVVRDGSNPTGNGGGVRVLSKATLHTSGDHQIVGNTAANGGGIFVDGGTVNLTSTGDVRDNRAVADGAGTARGGGIYAVNGAVVNLAGDADVFANAAADGGGVYADSSTVTATGVGTAIGAPGAGNVAGTGGGGVFATNGSLVTIGGHAQVVANTAGNFAGGVRLVGGATLRVDAGGAILDNEANGSGGGGVYGSSPSTIDLNPGSVVEGNTSTNPSGNGGGIVSFGTLDADGGTTSPMRPVIVAGNHSANLGGGILSAGSTTLDTVRVVNNVASVGGGGVAVVGGILTFEETGSCSFAVLGVDQYCNELRNNSTYGMGGALAATGGFTVVQQAGIIGNHANESAALVLTGSASAGLFSVVVFGNTDHTLGGDGLVTAKGISTLYLIAVTFADHTEAFLDSDDAPVAVVTSRVLTTTPALSLVETPSGSCNMGPEGAGLPGQIVAVPVFAVDPHYPGSPNYVGKHRSAHLPAHGSPARDACALLAGLPTDARGLGQLNGKGMSDPATDWDIGGLEAAPK